MEKKETDIFVNAGSGPNPNEQKSSVTTVEPQEEEEHDNEKNPFLNPEAAEYWRKVYENCQYECRHVFDPHITWSEEEEKRLVRKLDWRVCLWAVRLNPIQK